MIRAFDTLEKDIDYALKSSITECLRTQVRSALVKGIDEVTSILRGESDRPECTNVPVAPACCSLPLSGQSEEYEQIQAQLNAMYTRQDIQFSMLRSSVERMTELLERVALSLGRIQDIQPKQEHTEIPVSPIPVTITAERIIPTLQPVATTLETAPSDKVEIVEEVEEEVEEVEEEVEVDEEEVDEEEVDEEEVEEEQVEEEVKQEIKEVTRVPTLAPVVVPPPAPIASVEVEEEVEQEEVEEEGEEVEVEEWTFKNRKYFKDSENKVYANINGEIGDYLGTYDPLKNIVKK